MPDARRIAGPAVEAPHVVVMVMVTEMEVMVAMVAMEVMEVVMGVMEVDVEDVEDVEDAEDAGVVDDKVGAKEGVIMVVAVVDS